MFCFLPRRIKNAKNMIRYQKATRIELTKADIDEIEQVKKDLMSAHDKNKQQSTDQPDDVVPVVINAKKKQDEVKRRLGFTPQTVENDGTSGIHF